MAVVSLQKIVKHYGAAVVFQGLSLEIDEGRFTCLLGSSGSGKTTILRVIAGIEKITSGKVILNNILVNENARVLKHPSQRQIGFIFQELALWPHFTVYENIAFGLKIQKEARVRSKVMEMLDFFAITDHATKYPNQLSGGQQQLVAIARSLVLNPKILLMDEPLANLDVKLKSKIRKQIKGVQNNFSVTIIYVTHDHNEAFQLADEIIVINRGVVEQKGTPQEIQDSENGYVKEFLEI